MCNDFKLEEELEKIILDINEDGLRNMDLSFRWYKEKLEKYKKEIKQKVREALKNERER